MKPKEDTHKVQLTIHYIVDEKGVVQLKGAAKSYYDGKKIISMPEAHKKTLARLAAKLLTD